MEKTILFSMPKDDLQSLIIDCINSCLRFQPNQLKPSDIPEELLTVKEAAKFLNLSVPTIYSKCSRGELPVMKRGKRLYFSNTELLEYVKQGRKKTNSEIEAEADAYLSNKKKGLK